ncbi:phosphotransferase family protein [Saccharopolyspora mangrovi]|uniref:Phosphotransferase family protein n=1 Tax=Saccharopolyspora mangrovi TaxID=3082379 RepID=A0ABU6AIF8_9PSEU|nr:phosphotransferase family protein [Saccharopolyspora sp. S2-29]MEB3371348.1 phosphotransferase family protein [Saccharopolyspora sp. S2-29]
MSISSHVPPGINLPALQRYFDTAVSETAGPLTVGLITGGKSNLTYSVTDGLHNWVLRRPPMGPLTPTAHDMAREFRIVAALHGTGVPVARAVTLCENTEVLGAPFAVVSYVEGRTLRDGDDAEKLSSEEAKRCSRALVDTLAQLHAVPYDEVGLTGFGRPDGYLERQVRRWRGQWDRVATRELTAVDVLHQELARSLPHQSISAVVHGDYRIDNTILDSSDVGRIAAIVDWEMATLGDPLADLGLLQVYWDPVTEPVLGVRHAPTANTGFLSADELAERYSISSGLHIANLGFYRALGYFKMAVIAEGIHQRYLAGETIGDGFDRVGQAVPELLESGLDTLGARHP